MSSNSKYSSEKVNRNESSEIKKDNEIDVNNETVCICKRNCFGKMIACDECFEWFHYECVGIKEDEEPDSWICETCKNKNRIKNDKKKKKFKKRKAKS